MLNLGQVCAEDALKDSDPATRSLLLGFNSVDEYATWIRNEFHWGGENEILCLAKHYCVEVAVVCCESMQGEVFRKQHLTQYLAFACDTFVRAYNI